MAADSNIDPKKYAQAIASAEKLLKVQKDINKTTKSWNDMWGSLAAQMTQTSTGDWVTKIPKTFEEMSKSMLEISRMETQYGVIVDKINESLEDRMKANRKGADGDKKDIALKLQSLGREQIMAQKNKKDIIELNASHKDINGNLLKQKDFQIEMKKLQQKERDLNIESKKYYEDLTIKLGLGNDLKDEAMKKDLVTALATKDLSTFMEKYGVEAAMALEKTGLMPEGLSKAALQALKVKEEIKGAKKEASELDKSVLSFKKGLEAVAKNIVSGIWKGLLEFDTALHSIQRQTGMQLANTAASAEAMANLTVQASLFGMSIEDTNKMVSELALKMRTTNEGAVLGMADKMKDVQSATGASMEAMTDIASELARSGESAENIEKGFAGANVQAAKFGVSSAVVIGNIAKYIKEWRKFGFQGGEESLARMSARAERLGQNMDEIMAAAEKFRTVEGAMEGAAELQLAGGQFSNSNAMDLLASARNSPEELQKLLSKMGSDIGNFNKEAGKGGKYEFNAVDYDRLQIVSKATGQSVESLEQGIRKQAEDNKKLQFFPDNMFSIQGLDTEDIKNSISDALEMGEDGKITIKANNIFGKNNIDDLKHMSAADIKAGLDEQKKRKEDLATQAKANMSFQESFTAFKNAFVNLFNSLQPALKWLTGAIQGIASAFQHWYTSLLVLIPALMLFAPNLLKVVGKFGTHFKSIATIFTKEGGFKKGLAGMLKGAPDGKDSLTDKLAERAKRLKSLESKGATKGTLNETATDLSKSGQKSINMGNILKLAAAIAIISVAIIGLVYASSQLHGDWGQLAMMGAALVGLVGAIWALSLIAEKVQVDGVVDFSLAMVLIGAAMVPFAFAMSLMKDVKPAIVALAIGAMIALVLGVALLGAIMTGPQFVAVLIGAAGMVIVATAFLVSSLILGQALPVFEKISNMKWSSVMDMGAALLGVVPGLLAFSGAMLAFGISSFFGLIGLGATAIALMGLAVIVEPLAEALKEGADSMEKFSSGVDKLATAVTRLDFDKLEKLRDISSDFAAASNSGALADAMSKFADAISGAGNKGGTNGGGKADITVKLVMPNGRVLSETQIKDIEIVS